MIGVFSREIVFLLPEVEMLRVTFHTVDLPNYRIIYSTDKEYTVIGITKQKKKCLKLKLL